MLRPLKRPKRLRTVSVYISSAFSSGSDTVPVALTGSGASSRNSLSIAGLPCGPTSFDKSLYHTRSSGAVANLPRSWSVTFSVLVGSAGLLPRAQDELLARIFSRTMLKSAPSSETRVTMEPPPRSIWTPEKCLAPERKVSGWPRRCKLVHAIPVGIQLQKAGVGPTSGPTWRPSHLV
jgi:hypothetical protein